MKGQPYMSYEMEKRVRTTIERLQAVEHCLTILKQHLAAGDENIDTMAREAGRLAGICGQQARSLSTQIEAEVKLADLEAERQRILDAIKAIRSGSKTLEELNLTPKEQLAVALACNLALPPPYTSSDEAWADLGEMQRDTVARHNPQFKSRQNLRER